MGNRWDAEAREGSATDTAVSVNLSIYGGISARALLGRQPPSGIAVHPINDGRNVRPSPIDDPGSAARRRNDTPQNTACKWHGKTDSGDEWQRRVGGAAW